MSYVSCILLRWGFLEWDFGLYRFSVFFIFSLIRIWKERGKTVVFFGEEFFFFRYLRAFDNNYRDREKVV